MTTLVSVHNSEGCVGRCDARCYEAQGPDCDCVCGGKNHGAGLEKAMENTREWAEEWIAAYAAEKGLAEYEGVVGAEVYQLGFDLDVGGGVRQGAGQPGLLWPAWVRQGAAVSSPLIGV